MNHLKEFLYENHENWIHDNIDYVNKWYLRIQAYNIERIYQYMICNKFKNYSDLNIFIGKV